MAQMVYLHLECLGLSRTVNLQQQGAEIRLLAKHHAAIVVVNAASVDTIQLDLQRAQHVGLAHRHLNLPLQAHQQFLHQCLRRGSSYKVGGHVHVTQAPLAEEQHPAPEGCPVQSMHLPDARKGKGHRLAHITHLILQEPQVLQHRRGGGCCLILGVTKQTFPWFQHGGQGRVTRGEAGVQQLEGVQTQEDAHWQALVLLH
mmetsp:Transcript_106724/g.254804  ORF Transcript_106724/g.254804 Transcript_106724/m.254804 type:complete len:201 (-) Transcript_106724:1930-2532(-)